MVRLTGNQGLGATDPGLVASKYYPVLPTAQVESRVKSHEPRARDSNLGSRD